MKYIISNIPVEATTKIKQITIKKVDIDFTEKIKEHIEVMEIIDTSYFVNIIEDFNEAAFHLMVKQFINLYDKETFNYVNNKLTYQKEITNIALDFVYKYINSLHHRR